MEPTSRIRHRFAGVFFILLAILATAGPASANPGGPAVAQNQATRATAVVSFRIVIPEIVTFGDNVQRQPANAPTLTRTTTIESGVRLITIARP